MTKKTIGIGLISVGWMGRLHSKAYQSIRYAYPEAGFRPRLVIAADALEANADYAVDVLGYERSTLDFHEVLSHPEVDVVSICAPNFLHREFALAAAEAGKPFWIEKPTGRNAAETQDIVDAAAAAGLVTGVGFSYRQAPAIQKAKRLIADGALGEVTNVKVSLLADYSADPLGAFTWRYERGRAGSGVLGDLLSHGIDLASQLVAHISSVTALTQTVIDERPVPQHATVGHQKASADDPKRIVENEDYASLLARFRGSKAVGFFEASRVAVGPRSDYSIEVFGTTGSLKWSFAAMNELQVALGIDGDVHGYTTVLAGPGDGDYAHFQPGPGISMSFDDLKTIEAYQFLTSVVTGEQVAPSVADALAAARVVEAAEASAGDGAWHEVGAAARA
ncbi:myo-inositol 2-dehydrogenase [Frondihabitans sp. PAMC 28766]|uniref:Gfo/Idh/MocA family protein n=1 Tax=Frondihabitans sp. PAMC 28766 TaxID=1795630 RepID=UPI00078B6C8A|nr:Gfo/Idh/MocA family oxidoreductase [Frondihabitans sp. PAMC 28766]AMM20278.1 myo-inositol 2-dehydrogenase [Frondihabitans sp. PAMC 28766]